MVGKATAIDALESPYPESKWNYGFTVSYLPLADWPHLLQSSIEALEKGYLPASYFERNGSPRTGRWVIDDLYGAVQRKGRR